VKTSSHTVKITKTDWHQSTSSKTS